MLKLSSLYCNNSEMRSSTSPGQCFLRQWYWSDEDTIDDTLTSPCGFTSWWVINETGNWTILNWNIWMYLQVCAKVVLTYVLVALFLPRSIYILLSKWAKVISKGLFVIFFWNLTQMKLNAYRICPALFFFFPEIDFLLNQFVLQDKLLD